MVPPLDLESPRIEGAAQRNRRGPGAAPSVPADVLRNDQDEPLVDDQGQYVTEG